VEARGVHQSVPTLAQSSAAVAAHLLTSGAMDALVRNSMQVWKGTRELLLVSQLHGILFV